jgi:aminopeptidase N
MKVSFFVKVYLPLGEYIDSGYSPKGEYTLLTTKNMKYYLSILFFSIFGASLFAQTYTRQDSLRGALSPLRTCFDVTHYDLNLRLNIPQKSIAGHNTISYIAKTDFQQLQLDLFANMSLDSVVFRGKKLLFEREGNAFFVRFPQIQVKGSQQKLTVYYHGVPRAAVNPPWDGGFSFRKDKNGNDWIGVSCEGIGASLWFPNKDHLSDEPDSVRIYCEVPNGLTCVANGRETGRRKTADGYTGFEWRVSYPINNYNITLNVGKYSHFADTFVSTIDGEQLALDYYVLDYNTKQAKKHFAQVKPMLACFEKYFDKYPFWRDGYALVETSYWGMEHQGAIAYGNNYKNNKWGFDFIIIHESGHEYFGNSLSVNDHAEMWIHEAFTTYVEALYLECTQNYEVALAYLQEQKKKIYNISPMLGDMDINHTEWEGADIYYKGTWLLHSLRNTINDDKVWFSTIKNFYKQHKISMLNTQQVIDFFEKETGRKLAPIFYQYLKHPKPPRLSYQLVKENDTTCLQFRWWAEQPHFNMPMKFKLKGDKTYQTIYPTSEVQRIALGKKDVQEVIFAEELFYFILVQD